MFSAKILVLLNGKTRGKNPVNVISNMHDDSEEVNVLRTNTEGVRDSVPYSKSIADYNTYMGGVDKFDQLLAVYSISWKSRRWWLKILYYLLDCCIVNSYIYYKEDQKTKNQKPMFQLKYRSQLANDLLGNFCTRKRQYVAPFVLCKKSKNAKYINDVVTFAYFWDLS